MSDRLQDETESRKKMADKLSHERHQSQKEKESTQEVGRAFCVQNKPSVYKMSQKRVDQITSVSNVCVQMSSNQPFILCDPFRLTDASSFVFITAY